MNKYVNRYIYAVTKLLKSDQRKAVEEELTEYIENALKKDDSFEKTEKVLKELGSPRKLAYKYRNTGKNLIKQENYELYIDVLKIGLAIVFSVNLVSNTFRLFTDIINSGIGSISIIIPQVSDMLFGDLINSMLVGFAVITIGFIAWEKYGKLLDETDEWMLKDLPEVPKSRINLAQTNREIIFETLAVSVSSLFLLLVLRFPWIVVNRGSNSVTLSPNNYNTYFYVFISLIVVYLFNQLILIKQGKNLLYKVSKTLSSTALILAIGLFFFYGDLFPSSDILLFSEIFEREVGDINNSILITSIIIFVYTLISKARETYLIWRRKS
jgi:hypothetical protein